jgi:hypothetical protein
LLLLRLLFVCAWLQLAVSSSFLQTTTSFLYFLSSLLILPFFNQGLGIKRKEGQRKEKKKKTGSFRLNLQRWFDLFFYLSFFYTGFDLPSASPQSTETKTPASV